MEESATSKSGKLNQFYCNKLIYPTLKDVSCKESFMDCFMMLYDECVRDSSNCNDVNRDAIKFVNKCKFLIVHHHGQDYPSCPVTAVQCYSYQLTMF